MPSPRSSSLEIALALSAALCACAHGKTAPTVAVLPVETVGVPDEQGAAFHDALVKELDRTRTALPAPKDRVALALAAETEASPQPPCRESDACLARAGIRAQSDSVLSLTVAGLGNLWLVRGRLVRSQDALPLQEVQETAEGGVQAVDRYAPQLAHRLFPDARPWYRQWWLWTSVAVGLAAGGTALGVALGTRGGDGAVVIGSL